jgi:glutathione S-transferase
MKLYMHPGACSLSPHIVLRELGLPIDLIHVDRTTHRTDGGTDFHQINGNGYVPALELEDGTVLTEGPAIVQYLAGLRPDAALLPKPGTIARTRVQSCLNFITSELHKPMVFLLSPRYAAAREPVFELVEKRLGWLAAQLRGPYLMGETFTVADAYLFVMLNWSPWMGIDLGKWPTLLAYFERIGARPRVQDALAVEGLSPFEEEYTFYAPPAMVQARRAAREAARHAAQ